MAAKEQAKKEQRPQAQEGKLFRIRCRGCDFEKLRRHPGDANWFAKDHTKRGHEVIVEQIDEPAKKSTGKPPKKAAAKKGAKKEAKASE